MRLSFVELPSFQKTKKAFPQLLLVPDRALDVIINRQPDKPPLFWLRHYCFVLEKPKPVTTVFLDNQVFVEASFNFASAAFVALKKHFQSGRLRLLMTDVIINEVKNNITEEVKKEIDQQQPLLKIAQEIITGERGTTATY